MAVMKWLGPLRPPLRRLALSLLRDLLSTDEGRYAVSEIIPSPLDLTPELATPHLREPVYAELNRRAATSTPSRSPIFVTARFRSGSTLLWNLFRQVDGCTAYYEPLNERRWFDPSTRGDRIDRTHLGVDDYWREYEGMSDLGRFYDERWIDRHLYMNESFHAPALRQYIAELVERAAGRPVLQFNRVDFRLTWLRRQFPDATLVHLFRHPRDQWCSSLVDPTKVPRQVSVAEFPAYDHFYLLSWARDLRYAFPFLAPDEAAHPYDLFYMLWRLSYVWGRAYADLSICFEELVAHPAAQIEQLMRATDIHGYDAARLIGVVTPQPTGKWRKYADDDWFAAREAVCDAILQRELGARPRGVSAAERTAV